MLENLEEYERDILSAKFPAISRQIYPDSLLGISAATYQGPLVD
jgi:hypothetical protein